MKKILSLLSFTIVALCSFAQSPFNPVTGNQDFKGALKISSLNNNSTEDSILTVDKTTKKIKFVKKSAGTTIYQSGDSTYFTYRNENGGIDTVIFVGGQNQLNGTGFIKQSGITTTYVPQVSLTTEVSGVLPILNGGTGTATPGLIAGTNITSITGTWPNQTINAVKQVLDTTITWSVLDSLNAPPVPDSVGNKYLVGTVPTGTFATHANKIATYNGTIYTFQIATVGDLLLNTATAYVSKWNGTNWLRIGKSIIHQGGDSYGVPLSIGSIDAQPLVIKTANVPKIIIDANNAGGLIHFTPQNTMIGNNGNSNTLFVHGPGSINDNWQGHWIQDYNTHFYFGNYTTYAEFSVNVGVPNLVLKRAYAGQKGISVGKATAGDLQGVVEIAAPSGTGIASLPPIKFTLPATLLDSARKGSIEASGNYLYYTGDTIRKKVVTTQGIITSAAATLTLLYGTDYIFTGTTSTWTLPAVNASITGRNELILIKNRGSGNITVNSNAGSTIYTTAAVGTISVIPGSSVQLLPDGTFFNEMKFN